MSEDSKIPSLSIFFPFMNDAGTVRSQITSAYKVGRQVTNDLEVIALHGGASKDSTHEEILKMKELYPELIVVDKRDNWEKYAVIKYGFNACTKEWVFYTDGDAQYDVFELISLVKKQLSTGSDVINGYKSRRGDGYLRGVLGTLYAKFSNFVFELPIRDTDCDFRLIRRELMDRISLESHDSSILAEMLKKLELVGARFVEVPVSHFERRYGNSNYTPFELFKEKLVGDLTLYRKMRKIKNGVNSLRIVKFGSIGLISIGIQVLLFNLLMAFLRVSPGLATILSDQLAIISSFIMNNSYTFYDKRHIEVGNIIMAFTKFWSIVIIATIIQAAIVVIGTRVFGRGFIAANFFFMLGIAVTFFWNYTTQKKFVWKY